MPNIEQAKIDFEQVLLNASTYSGNKKKEQKIFSASMLGTDMLQIYLKYYHGSSDQKQFGMNTLGSIYQLGADRATEMHDRQRAIDTEPQYENALRLTYKLSNGWVVSGEMDHVDSVNKVIIDNKVVTETAVINVKKEGKNNSYALQMAVYQFLLYKSMQEGGIENPTVYKPLLTMVNKGFSHYKKSNKLQIMNMIEPDTHTLEDTEALLLEKTNQLQEYIDLGEAPPECANLWWFGFGAAPKRKMRCLYYCDQSKNCDHLSDHNVMANLLGQL